MAVAVDFLDEVLALVVFGADADADASAVVGSRRLGGLKGRRLRFWTVFWRSAGMIFRQSRMLIRIKMMIQDLVDSLSKNCPTERDTAAAGREIR